ncbi:hypothetical protein R1sor_022961 [Riccia sorocarpa]|uniref:Uncharacterized protein n=1 Tax=Riccia sorocarpa TaxID=122646 RepID=A0ABD3GPP5_9MARC
MSDSSSGSQSDGPAPKCPRFLPLDPTEVANVEKGGCMRSRYSEGWADKLFQDWQKAEGKDCCLSVADRSEREDTASFVDDLSFCILQERKENSELYNPKSLEGLVMGFGRLIRARQAERAIQSGEHCVPFNIMSDPRFAKVVVAGNESVERSVRSGLGEALRFREGHSKNYKFSLAKARVEQHRPHVDCHIPDVIFTSKQLQAKRPKVWNRLKEPPRPLFLTPKQNFRLDAYVWFKEGPVGENTLAKFSARMTEQLVGREENQ